MPNGEPSPVLTKWVLIICLITATVGYIIHSFKNADASEIMDPQELYKPYQEQVFFPIYPDHSDVASFTEFVKSRSAGIDDVKSQINYSSKDKLLISLQLAETDLFANELEFRIIRFGLFKDISSNELSEEQKLAKLKQSGDSLNHSYVAIQGKRLNYAFLQSMWHCQQPNKKENCKVFHENYLDVSKSASHIISKWKEFSANPPSN